MFDPLVLTLEDITQFFDRGSVLAKVAETLDLGVMLPDDSQNIVYVDVKGFYATGGDKTA
jgi:hypothetical protein